MFADLPAARPSAARAADPRALHRIVMTSVWGAWLAGSVLCLVIRATIAVAQGSPGYFWPVGDRAVGRDARRRHGDRRTGVRITPGRLIPTGCRILP